jgi:hypothetical protein
MGGPLFAHELNLKSGLVNSPMLLNDHGMISRIKIDVSNVIPILSTRTKPDTILKTNNFFYINSISY